MKTFIYKIGFLLFFCLFGILQLKGEDTLSSSFTTASKPYSYKLSVGGVVPPTAMGVSVKISLQENLFLQTDVFYAGRYYLYRKDTSIFFHFYPSIESNTNIMYQEKLKEKKGADLFWFIGGGITLGGWCFKFLENVKTELNALIGLEYVFKTDRPVSFQIDFRPGCALIYNPNYKKPDGWFDFPKKKFITHFDCLFFFTVRRAF